MKQSDFLNRAGAMQSALCFKVSGMGLLGRFVGAKTMHNAIDLQMSSPARTVLMNAEKSAFVSSLRPSLIPHVFGTSYIAQVADPVVVANPVDVVDLAIGPDTINVKPSKAVSGKIAVANLDPQVSSFIKSASNIVSLNGIYGANLPAKNAGIGVVVQFVADTLKRYFPVGGFGFDPKVGNAVIGNVAVDPLQRLLLKQNAVHIKPSKDMCVTISAINADDRKARWSDGASLFASGLIGSAINTPSENTRFGVVVQKFFKTLLRQSRITVSHFVAPVKQWIGQMPDSVRSGFGHRHFSMGGA